VIHSRQLGCCCRGLCPRTHSPPPPPHTAGGLNVFGANTSANPTTPGGYFPLDSTTTPYTGPPQLSSSSYTIFIGIAWSLVGGLVDAIDEFRVPIWRTIKPAAVWSKLKFLLNLAALYTR